MKRLLTRVLVSACLVALSSLSSAVGAQQAGKKEYTFRGTIEKVDVKAQKLTVNGEAVAGWMVAMTMNYKVDKPEVLKQVKAGDSITATVYDGDQETLYNVTRTSPADDSTGGKDRKE